MQTTDITSKKHIAKLLFFLIYVCLTFIVMSQHEPWEDELHAWILARELSVPQLFYHMRYEGHFCLWHLVLKPFVVFGTDVMFLNLASFLFCTAGSLFFWERAPFGFGCKAAVLFSYPLFYFFPAVARPYSLIPLLLWLIAALYPVRLRESIWYALLIALIAQTHAYMAGFAVILTILFVYDLYRTRKHTRSGLRKNGWIGLILIAASALAAMYQVLPAFTSSIHAPSGMTVLTKLQNACDELQALPGRFAFFLTNNMGIIPAAILFFGLFLLAGILLYRHSRKVFLIYFISILWQILFSICIYKMDLQRIFLPLLIMIFCFWLVRGIKSCKKNKVMIRAANIVIILLCVMTYPETLSYSIRDYYLPFSNQLSAVGFIKKYLPTDAKIYVFPPELLSGTFSAYLPQYHFYSSADGQEFRYFLYDRNNKHKPDSLNDAELDRLVGNSNETFYILLQIGMVQQYKLNLYDLPGSFLRYDVKLIYGPEQLSFFTAGEDYLIFEVKRR